LVYEEVFITGSEAASSHVPSGNFLKNNFYLKIQEELKGGTITTTELNSKKYATMF